MSAFAFILIMTAVIFAADAEERWGARTLGGDDGRLTMTMVR